jgi:hypothetical protein
VANAVWDAAARGSTWCTIVGSAPGACLAGATSVFVVRGDDDGINYSLTSAVLRSYLVKKLKPKCN